MFPTFRLSMTWLHTWFGLVLGYVLIVVFFFGALSVFDREIDRWAIPETRFAPQPMPSFDRMLAPIFKRIVPEAHELDEARARVGGPLLDTLPLMNWSAYTTHRDPVLMMFAEFAVTNNPDDPDDHVHGHVTIDPRSGRLLSDDKLKIGSEFFYPMHYGLHLTWKDLGIWIVGLSALAMLAALVSGIVIHRRIFREFFTFRPRKHVQRSTLDLHNLTGVVALPFHFFFALTGLTIFASMYLPVSETMLAPHGCRLMPTGMHPWMRPDAEGDIRNLTEPKGHTQVELKDYVYESFDASRFGAPPMCPRSSVAADTRKDKG